MLIDVSENRLAQLTALGEGFTTEFKRSVPSNLGAEVCAFANATGGVILIGVTDDGDVVGVGSHNRLKSQVQTTARSADPPIAVEVESVGDVLVVTVPEQHSKPYSLGIKYRVTHKMDKGLLLWLPSATVAKGVSDINRTSNPPPHLVSLATPELNRNQKGDRDAAEWLPDQNRCWFAARIVAVRQEYLIDD